MIGQGDPLALELVEVPGFLRDILDLRVGRSPVRAADGEAPLEHLAVGTFAQAVGGGQDRDPVGRPILTRLSIVDRRVDNDDAPMTRCKTQRTRT